MEEIIVDLSTGEQTVRQLTEEETAERIATAEAAESATPYAEKRIREYPDFREYLDGVVKGDNAQVQAYIDACLAVKAKYPKQ